MKRCPICEKVYEYESLRFCRFDGARLVDFSWREAPTVLFEDHELPPHKTGGLLVDSGTHELKLHRHR